MNGKEPLVKNMKDNLFIQITSNLRDTRRRHVTVFVHRGTRVNTAIFKRAGRDLERAALRLLRDLDTFRGGDRFRVLLPLNSRTRVPHDLTG